MGLFWKIMAGYGIGSVVSCVGILILFSGDDPSGDAGLAGAALAVASLVAWPAVDSWLVYSIIATGLEQRGYRKDAERRRKREGDV